MSADALQLRSLLQRVDATAPTIQAAAGAMMKHYDRSPGVAVVEWRNALQQSNPDQHLPLLYVANEVLQNSKRNRGNKFLESFSPILGQSLIFICQKSPGQVEKIRRTAKIWGERHVFSIRFVNELLHGLEPYRNGGPKAQVPPAFADEMPPSGRFSPEIPTAQEKPPEEAATRRVSDPKEDFDLDAEMARTSTDGFDVPSGDEEDDDDDDLFGDSSKLLDISIDLDAAAAMASENKRGSKRISKTGVKRRRSSTGSAGGGKSRRILTTNSLIELWNQVESLQQGHDHASALVSALTDDYLNPDQAKIEGLVGDELLAEFQNTSQQQSNWQRARQEFHRIARQRRSLEAQSVRYLPWLEALLKQDKDDLQMVARLESNIKLIMAAQKQARAARDKERAEREQRQKEAEEKKKKEQEEEERRKFMESAMKKETVAKPGMVWNRNAGEYQYLNTEESWRD